jgi:SAM-dependent methyltransferase
MLKYNPKHFKIIKGWGLDKNPYRAIDDYSETKAEQRHLNKDWKSLYTKYVNKRKIWTEGRDHKKFYRKTYNKPIDKWTWEYLRKRKQYFQMPLGWEKIVKSGGTIIDVGCGDGDFVQNFIDYAEKIIKKKKLKSKIYIHGIDVNHSRVENAKKLVSSKLPNIKFSFKCADFAKTNISKFDHAFASGLFGILDDKEFSKFVQKLEKNIKKTIYIEEILEPFPGGFPRYHMGKYFKKFKVLEKHKIFTEPLNLKKIEDPKKLWPVHIVQNIVLERMK